MESNSSGGLFFGGFGNDFLNFTFFYNQLKITH